MRWGRCRRFAPRSTTSATLREMPSGWRRSATAWPCSRRRCGRCARPTRTCGEARGPGCFGELALLVSGWLAAAGAGLCLAGEEPEPRGPGIPRVDDRGACDEIVQRAVLALHQDAGEAEAEQQEAERERQRAEHRVPRAEGRAVGPHHPHAEHGHAERLAARRPRVAEVGELPGDEQDRDDDVLLAP